MSTYMYILYTIATFKWVVHFFVHGFEQVIKTVLSSTQLCKRPVAILATQQMGGLFLVGTTQVPLQHIDAMLDLDCRESQEGDAKLTVNGLEKHQLVNVSLISQPHVQTCSP